MQINEHTQRRSAVAVKIDSLGGTLFTQKDFNKLQSSGKISGGITSHLGGNNISTSSGTGLLRSTNSPQGDLHYISWDTLASYEVPVNETRYMCVSYNAGTPTVAALTSFPTDTQTFFYLSEIHNLDGTNMMIHNDPFKIQDLPHRTQEAWQGVIGNRVVDGEVFSGVGTRQIAVTAGTVWDRHLNLRTTVAVNTLTGSTVYHYYRNGSGGYTRVSGQIQWDNLRYDNGTGTLAALGAGKFGVHYIMRNLNGEVAVLYGREEYADKTAADGAVPPTEKPEEFDEHGFFVATIVFEQNINTIRTTYQLRPQAVLTEVPNPLPIAKGGTGRQNKKDAIAHFFGTGTDGQVIYADSTTTSGTRWGDTSGVTFYHPVGIPVSMIQGDTVTVAHANSPTHKVVYSVFAQVTTGLDTWYEACTVGRIDSSADFGIRLLNDSTAMFKRHLAGTSNVVINFGVS